MNYSKALVIGAGSGRDIASAVLITEKLREKRTEVDLAGFLTPWALHEFDDELERPVNKLSERPTRKFIANREAVSLDSYFEQQLMPINRELGLGIGDIFLFSLHYGTERLRIELEKLVAQKGYDFIVAVDVGGDILARRKDLGYVFTPIVDLSCLEILANLKITADKHLAVVSPGVDGELTAEQLTEIIRELDGHGLIECEKIKSENRSYHTFVRVYDELNKRTKSSSHTGEVIKRVVETDSDFRDEYVRNLRVHDKTWRVAFPVQLDKALAGRIFYFDLEAVKSRRKDIRVCYETILQAHMHMKLLGAGGTEVDLTYVPRQIINGRYSDCVFILDPFNRVAVRKELVDYGLSRTKEIGTSLVPICDLPATQSDFLIQRSGIFCYVHKLPVL